MYYYPNANKTSVMFADQGGGRGHDTDVKRTGERREKGLSGGCDYDIAPEKSRVELIRTVGYYLRAWLKGD